MKDESPFQESIKGGREAVHELRKAKGFLQGQEQQGSMLHPVGCLGEQTCGKAFLLR